jgi:hypothetical protein
MFRFNQPCVHLTRTASKYLLNSFHLRSHLAEVRDFDRISGTITITCPAWPDEPERWVSPSQLYSRSGAAPALLASIGAKLDAALEVRLPFSVPFIRRKKKRLFLQLVFIIALNACGCGDHCIYWGFTISFHYRVERMRLWRPLYILGV